MNDTAPASGGLGNPRILLVDDSRLARAAMRDILEAAGYQNIVEATSAAEAFGLLGLGKPGVAERPAVDLVLLDGVLPDMDGISACRMIKADERLARVPVIMVTAREGLGNLSDAFAAGVMDYIAKPIGEVELLARVRSAISFKQESDRRRRKEEELFKLAGRFAEANKELRRITNLDGLTGVANRRFFDQEFERQWRRSQRSQTPLAVLMMDIDHFKLYNDRYGHQQGDECLRAVARALQARAKRPADLVARYGGEEFVALLPETPAVGVLALAREMCSAVAGLGLEHASSPVAPHVTLSVGAAWAMPARDRAKEELLADADRALYRAKDQGRNRAVAA